MPYSSITEAKKKNPGLKKYSDKAKNGWLQALNSCLKDGGDESKCFATAYSVANKIQGKKASVEETAECPSCVVSDNENPNAKDAPCWAADELVSIAREVLR